MLDLGHAAGSPDSLGVKGLGEELSPAVREGRSQWEAEFEKVGWGPQFKKGLLQSAFCLCPSGIRGMRGWREGGLGLGGQLPGAGEAGRGEEQGEAGQAAARKLCHKV